MLMDTVVREFSSDTNANDIDELLVRILSSIIVEEGD